jgi:glycosyltransferase involved in cell wall biosynthesis
MIPSRRAEDVPSVDLSIVCVVGSGAANLAEVHRAYADVVARTGRSAEFLYVFNGPRPEAESALLASGSGPIPRRLLRMAKGFGEAAALDLGFTRAHGRFVVTIPARFQVEPEDLLAVLARLDAGAEVVVTRREPRRDPWINRIQARVFHGLTRRLSGKTFHDMTCGLRGFTREAARALDLYGDIHRFLPILAGARGFQVEEIPVRQRDEDVNLRVFRPGVYARRLIDILHIFFLTKFAKKPLRFFGLVGLTTASIGLVLTVVITLQRLIGGRALAERPLLLLGILLLALGVQVVSIGLIGEIVIFLGSRGQDIPAVEVEPDEE